MLERVAIIAVLGLLIANLLLSVVQQFPQASGKVKNRVEQTLSRDSELCITVASPGDEDRDCVSPSKSGVINSTLAGPDGQSISVYFSSKDKELVINIVSPGVFPEEEG